MKAIKVTAFQESANYKVPISHDFRESYPLPPYSTIIGMVHYLCDFKEYHPMKISIQGSYGSTTSDLYTEYEFKNGMKFEPKRHQLNVNGLGVSRGVAQVQLMIDVRLVLHIIPADQTEVDNIYNCLKCPREYPSIGRREDLAVFENVEIVEVSQHHLNSDLYSGEYVNGIQQGKRSNWAAYIPTKTLEEADYSLSDSHGLALDMGTQYRLNKVYSLVKTRKNRPAERRWDKKAVTYIEFKIWEGADVEADNQGDIVFAV